MERGYDSYYELRIQQIDSISAFSPGPRNNFKDIETTSILRSRLLAKAELIHLPGFQIFLNINPFSMKSNYSPNSDHLLGMARVFFFIQKNLKAYSGCSSCTGCSYC